MDVPSGSSTAALRAIALTLVHALRPRARMRLGSSAGLKGSGMCFSQEAITRTGWTAAGLAEDAEQHVCLVCAGMRVVFAPDAVVAGTAPRTLTESSRQHTRWEAGRLSAAWSHSGRLLRYAARSHSLTALDAACDLLIPPISVLACTLGVYGVAGAVFGTTLVSATAAVGLTGLTLYIAAGVWLARPRPRDLAMAVVTVPFYVAWKAVLYACALIRRPPAWEATRAVHLPPVPPHSDP